MVALQTDKDDRTPRRVFLRAFGPLNDFLPPPQRGKVFAWTVRGIPSVKDTVEAAGLVHPEIALIRMDDESVGFEAPVTIGASICVYPWMQQLPLSVQPLRPALPKPLRFLLDVHLGGLTKRLRWLGFDTRYREEWADANIVRRAREDERIILTRDIGLLRRKAVTHGYFVRAREPDSQLLEIALRYDLLDKAKPFTRCSVCNVMLRPILRQSVASRVPAQIFQNYRRFWECEHCQRVYWRGSHYDRMYERLQRMRAAFRPMVTGEC